jgi:hypothetical protein
VAWAQSSIITATITDPDGQIWANGTYTINFVPTPGVPGPFSWQGSTNFPLQFQGALSSIGLLALSLPDNSFISPVGSKWQFTLCSQTSAPCQNVVTSVIGPAPNLSTILSSALAAPRFSAGTNAFGYLDTEVAPPLNPGAQYYNVVSQVLRLWNGSVWGNSSGGALLNTPNTWTAIQTFSADIVFTPAGGPNLKVNRAISTSANTPVNGGSWLLGPTDPVVYGCPGCTPSLSFYNFTSSNGIPVMNLLKPNGSSGPVQMGDYKGMQAGFGPAGSQSFGSGQAANADLVGELAFSAATTVVYTWVASYTTHPECTFTPQFDYSTNRFWVTYTGVASFTLNFSAAVTGTVGYTCIYRN